MWQTCLSFVSVWPARLCTLLLVCVLMTSVSIVKEKEKGTMEILLVSPMNPFIVIIAKAVPYFFLSLINLTVILLMSIYLLDMPMNGSILLLYFVSSIFCVIAFFPSDRRTK